MATITVPYSLSHHDRAFLEAMAQGLVIEGGHEPHRDAHRVGAGGRGDDDGVLRVGETLDGRVEEEERIAPRPIDLRDLERAVGSLDLRCDLAGTGVRVTSVEPGMAETEFTIVRTGGDKDASDRLYAGANPMTADDLADMFWWLANLPPHLNINVIELMPVSQSFAGFAVHREA